MSVSALPPTPSTTLVILLGASAWPNSPGFQASKAFVHAVQGFRDYVLDPHVFGLPRANLFDQFDAPASASDQLELLGSFLEQRMQALKTANQVARDVLVYFVGHGGFAGPSADFYLLLRRTNASSLRASGMAIDALAEVLREKARQMRRYLFLDCCFAAAAFRAFQGGPDQTAITKTLDAFAVQARSHGFPRRGTVLLCSSDQKSPSLLLPDESCTMFSYALLDVLKNGDLYRPRQLSLRDLKELAEDRLSALPEKTAPRPSLHSPDQSEGDVADIPLFPNPYVEREQARLAEEERRRQVEQARKVEEEMRRRLEEERTWRTEEELARRTDEEKRRQAEEVERARLAMEKRMQNIVKQGSPMPGETLPPPSSPHTAVPPQHSAMLSPPLSPSRPNRLGSPSAFVVLILLTLILLGGGSFGVFRAATGNWPWNASHQPSTPITPGAVNTTPIKIGTSLSFSGDFSADGMALKQGYQLWVNDVNKAGGLLGRQVQLDVLDDRSSAYQVQTNYQTLITVHKDDLVFGPFSTLLTKPASVVASRYGYAMVEGAGGGPSVFTQGLNNVFDVSLPVANDLVAFANYIQTLSASKKPTSIAYATEDDPFTRPQIDTAKALFEQQGIKTASYQVYPAETTDYNPIADKIIASGAQVVVVGTLLPDVSAFIQRFKQQHYNPQALIATAGPDQGDQFLKATGGATSAEGIMVPNGGWFPQATTPGNVQMVQEYIAKYGGTADGISSDVAEGYAVGQVVQQAVKKIGSLDNQKLIAQLHSDATYTTVQGSVKFDNTGQNTAATAYLFQWQNGSLVPVYPTNVASAQPEYPRPNWP